MSRRDQLRLLPISVGCLIGFVLAMTAIFCGCASRTGKALNVAVISSALADVHSSQSLSELNPVMGQSPWQQGIVKAAGVSTVIAGAWLVEQRNRPILAHVVRGAVSAVWFAAAAHNYRLSGGTR